MKMTFRLGEQTKHTKVNYFVIEALYSYNIIIWRLAFNHLVATLSTLYLCMKYSLSNGRVRVIQGDQEVVRKCYVESLKMKKSLNYRRKHHKCMHKGEKIGE